VVVYLNELVPLVLFWIRNAQQTIQLEKGENRFDEEAAIGPVVANESFSPAPL